MKGYTISLKSNLLEPKHFNAMGDSIWLYLWFLDKMTSIQEGSGKVLGGKPITPKDVYDDMGISIRTYKRWLNRLRNAGYIETIRTPHGLSIRVTKAEKIFGQRSAKTVPSQNPSDVPQSHSDVPKPTHRSAKTVPSNIRQYKDNTIDNTKTQGEDELPEINQPDSLTSNAIKPKARRGDKSSPDINGVLAAFEEALGLKLRRRENQRRMAHNLIREYGVDDVLSAIKAVKLIKDERYAPQILDLQDLWEKWDKLGAFFRRKKREQTDQVAVIKDDEAADE